VQVGGFAEIANAHQAQDRLKAAGQASIIAPAETARGTLYRVRAGPYASREAAAAARVALVAAGFGEPAVVGP
jgi:DedD protein